MKKIFYNPKENKLRAGWGIFIFICLFWILASIIFVVKPFLGDIGKREYLENYTIIIVAILAIAATLAISISRRYLDKKTFVSLGLKINKRTIWDLLFGFILSGFIAGLFFILLCSFNLIEFSGVNFKSINEEPRSFDFVTFMSTISIASLSVLLLEHILVGYWEELFFRGYLLQNLIEGIGLKLAIIVSCLLYGLIHYINPNAGLLSSLIICMFGFMRIYGFLLTRLLWLSIGMHIGWNFFQGPIFGFAASGHKKATLISHNLNSNKDWLTGSEFGPEGSVIIIPLIILSLFLMHFYNRKMNYIEQLKLKQL